MSDTIGRRFVGKVVLVTGGAGAIGSAAVRRFAGEGARVAILDRDRAGAAALAGELANGGSDALAIAADVGSEERRGGRARRKSCRASAGSTFCSTMPAFPARSRRCTS